MHAFAVCQPRKAGAAFIKPSSAMAYPLAIIRIFGRWGISMPSFKALKASYAHLARLYLEHHGPYSLSPRRAEPIKRSMVVAMDRIPRAQSVGGRRWEGWDVLNFRAINTVLWETGHRLSAVVYHTSGEIMYFTFESLVWVIDGHVIRNPTREQLNQLKPGRDYALLFPPRSKPDQWGELHSPFPSVLLYYQEPANAASNLRDIELHAPCAQSQRSATPLFRSSSGEVYRHAFLDRMLKRVLLHCFGVAATRVYTWHSYRVGLATALYAAGVTDAEIQLICRWLCAASLRIYRRMGIHQQATSVRQASSVRMHTLQGANVARVADDLSYAHLSATSSWDLCAQARVFADKVRGANGVDTRGVRPNAVPPVSADEAFGSTPAHILSDHPEQPDGTQDRASSPSAAPSHWMLAPASLWPNERCAENDGLGWTVAPLHTDRNHSVVTFVHARDPRGRPYAPLRVSRDLLRPLP